MYKMKNAVIVLFILILLIEIIITIRQKREKRAIEDALTKYILEGEYDSFYKMVDSKEATRNIPVYNRLFLKLNAAMAQSDNERAEEILRQLETVHMSETQMVELALKAFNYYIERYDREGAHKYKNIICKYAKNESITELTKRTYSIFIEQSDEYLDVLLKESEHLKGNKRISHDLLLAKIYENKGEIELCNKYKEQSVLDMNTDSLHTP